MAHRSYNQVMHDLLTGNTLTGFQDERGRWHVDAESATRYVTEFRPAKECQR